MTMEPMNKHTATDLAQMQSLPLEAKILMTQLRIRAWYEYWHGMVYVSVSGIDSTVLKHIVDSMYSDVPAVFVNTGLEYPEIQTFWKDVQKGKYPCFNSDVEIIRPKMRFDEVLKKYGYPVISKEVSKCVKEARKARDIGNYDYYSLQKLEGRLKDKDGNKSIYNCEKYGYLMDLPVPMSSQCCDVMKKRPVKKYSKDTGRMAIIGTMAEESMLRKQHWLKYGCNAFDKKIPTSQPLSFWTKQDILHYVKKYNVPYPQVYGDIVLDSHDEDDQMNFIDYLGDYEPGDRLKTTGCERTGCIFCMFGCHLEKEPNRFQKLKETHPRQYEYCIFGGEYITEGYAMNSSGEWVQFVFEHDDGTPFTQEEIDEFIKENESNPNYQFRKKLQPTKEGLGLGKVLDYIGVKYE